LSLFFFFFFFQAEDGIRDFHVTGVQTCALPILTFASSSIGAPSHLAGELFNQLTSLHILHVPYRGSAPALTDLIGGQVDMMFDKIGRASCRERGEVSGVAVRLKKKKARDAGDVR